MLSLNSNISLNLKNAVTGEEITRLFNEDTVINDILSTLYKDGNYQILWTSFRR